jgi:hypothetical protein
MANKIEKKQAKAASTASSKKNKASSTAPKPKSSKVKQKRLKSQPVHQHIIGSFKLSWQTLLFIKKYWKPLGGIVLVYDLIKLFFASGLVGNASSVVGNFHSGKFADALSSFSSLLTGSSDQTATMQTVLFVIESLVIIWTLRHLFSGEQIGIKHAYYHSTSSLIPFVLVLFVIILQLLPITISSAIFAIILSSIVGNSFVEAIFTFLFVASAFWSIYMLCSSVFALYIITLPNMEPRSALKSAKNLVANRRWHVIRRLLFLPLLIIVVMGVFTVPLILYAKFLVTPTFFILSMLSILFAHTYLYSFYRGLLKNE